MLKMWSFSTLQRPTQEEKERRRKYKDDKARHANTLLPKSKVGRAKTFRERNNNDVDFVSAGPTSLPVSASMVEVLRHRAKSATRNNTEDAFYYGDYATSTKRRGGHKDRDPSAHGGFVSRLRFFDSATAAEPQKLRWQDREPSSGYSSGGGRGSGGQDLEVGTSDDNMYGGVKFASIPHTSSSKGCGPSSSGEMVSRRKILSRSRDDLHMEAPVPGEQDEEDVWYQKEKLYKEHIQEVLNKWQSIDDEIWAKIIVLERNRRVAKAYARAPVLTVNGSDDGFDGFRIGLAGFENPMRDPKTEEVKRNIGQGCKIKMDDSGNILVKRIAKSNVYVKVTSEENSVSNDILKLPHGALEPEKPVKLFDMKKFQQNVSREMRRAYPDRRKLETQCISAIAFVRNEAEILDSPCWIMLINIVAMDMLKSKMPPIKNPRSAIDIRNRPRIPVPDEDPYSIAGSGSSGSSGNGNRERSRDNPPKLPPRDTNSIYATGKVKPDYDQMDEPRFRQESRGTKQSKKDDPYYCGLRARIPNFAKSKAQKEKETSRLASVPPPQPVLQQQQPHPMAAWHGARGYLDNVPHPGNMTSGFAFRNRPFERNPTTWVPSTPMRNDYESDYSHIYGRLPVPTRGFRQYPPPRGQIYVSEWE